jgi:hypothetical protein
VALNDRLTPYTEDVSITIPSGDTNTYTQIQLPFSPDDILLISSHWIDVPTYATLGQYGYLINKTSNGIIIRVASNNAAGSSGALVKIRVYILHK